MKEKQAVSLETLNGLLSERQRYEEWLAALESRRANTSVSVYEKVRSDYQSRLKEVSDRLAARAGELRASIESLTTKLQELGRDETAQHESRQEAELRAAVGEYNEDEWRRIKQESEKELAKIAKERTATESRLAELNRVVALSSGSSEGTTPAQATVSPPSRSGVIPIKRPSASGWPQRDDGDSTNVVSVSSGSRTSSGDARGSGTGDAKSTGSSGPSPFDEFAGLAKPAVGGSSGAADEGGTGTERAAGGGAPAATKSKTPPASIPVGGSSKSKGGLPDLRTEQQKTLKCPECGASNYPTEWYCERCGGELATL